MYKYLFEIHDIPAKVGREKGEEKEVSSVDGEILGKQYDKERYRIRM